MADSGYPIGIISIHALHEESDAGQCTQGAESIISIHALHEESDQQYGLRALFGQGISIHALHEESD